MAQDLHVIASKQADSGILSLAQDLQLVVVGGNELTLLLGEGIMIELTTQQLLQIIENLTGDASRAWVVGQKQTARDLMVTVRVLQTEVDNRYYDRKSDFDSTLTL